MKLNDEERWLLAQFMSALSVYVPRNFPSLLEWLRVIDRGEDEWFLRCFPGQEETLNLLKRMIEQMPEVKKMVSESNASVNRLAMIDASSGSEAIRKAQETKMRELIIYSVRFFSGLTKKN